MIDFGDYYDCTNYNKFNVFKYNFAVKEYCNITRLRYYCSYIKVCSKLCQIVFNRISNFFIPIYMKSIYLPSTVAY